MAVGEDETALRVHNEAARVGAASGLGVCAPVLSHPAITNIGSVSGPEVLGLNSTDYVLRANTTLAMRSQTQDGRIFARA